MPATIKLDDFTVEDLRELVAQADASDGKYHERMVKPHFWIGRVTAHLEEIIRLADAAKSRS